jgi:hypothetical protein
MAATKITVPIFSAVMNLHHVTHTVTQFSEHLIHYENPCPTPNKTMQLLTSPIILCILMCADYSPKATFLMQL